MGETQRGGLAARNHYVMTNSAAPHASPRPSSSATPEALLARYRATGEPEALGALFDGTAPVLFRMALSLTTDAAVAEDCVQETYLAALESLERYDATKAVMPWLVGILQIMVRRSRRERTRVPDPIRVAASHPTEAGDEAAIDVEHDEEAREIRGAIDSLDEPYRSVALLRWRYGLSPAEIADVRGEPPGTVRSLLSRALERMRRLLKTTPALALLPLAPLGLAAVREAVILRGVELGIGTVASAAGVSAAAGLGLSTALKTSIAAVALVAVGAGLFAWRPWASGSGASNSERAAVVEPDRSAPAPKPPTEPAEVVPAAPAPEPTDAPPPPPVVPEPEFSAPPHPEAETPTAPPVPRDPTLDPQLGVDPAMAAPNGAAPAPAPVPPIVVNPADPDDEGTSGAFGERIDAAVARGVKWLKQHQLPDGSWGLIEGTAAYDGSAKGGDAYKHPAGSTALALYALLKCGESVDDPVVKKGFRYLKDRQKLPGGAYETSMMLLAVTATADPYRRTKDSEAAGEKVKLTGEWRDWAQKLHASLLAKRAKAKTLGWRYQIESAGTPPGGNEDLSSTQLAALALLAADRCGIKAEASVWNDLITFAMKQQEDDGPAWPRAVYDRPPAGAKPSGGDPGRYAPPSGAAATKDRARGFAYIKSDALSPDEGQPTGGMTACGIGVLQMARYVLAKREDKAFAARDTKAIQASIYDGLAWLDANWSPFANPKKAKENVYHVYYLYCVERSLDLIGNVLLGRHRWYAEMAQELVARQTEKGFWDSDSTHKPQEVLDTSFALLFLRRATDYIRYGSVTEPGDAPPADERGGR